jgi:translation elongation factor EF-Tu-like GTPase
MGARFRVEAAFGIKRRGTVITGRILEGTITPGMRVSIPKVGAPKTIVSVETLKGFNKRETIGLLLDVLDPDMIAKWNTLNLNGMELEIEDADSA